MKPTQYLFTVAVRTTKKKGEADHWTETQQQGSTLEEVAAALGVKLDDLHYITKTRLNGSRRNSMSKYWENLPTKPMSEETKEKLRQLHEKRKGHCECKRFFTPCGTCPSNAERPATAQLQLL